MRVGYISLNSIEEPLVQSQVLSYIKGLAARGVDYWLLTFEPEAPDEGRQRRIQAELQSFGIQWYWTEYPRRRSAMAFLSALNSATRKVFDLLAETPTDILHARSLLPAIIARRVSRRTGVPFIFDVRGFWAAEKAYKRRLPLAFLSWRILDRYERKLMKDSHGIVVLSEAAGRLLRKWDARRGTQKPLEVIPTCVNTTRFRPGPRRTEARAVRLVYIGSLGPGYLPVETMRFAKLAESVFESVELLILSRTEDTVIRQAAAAAGLNPDSYTSLAVPFDEIPARLESCDAGICFIAPHYSKIASCPTKLGEYLSAGLPVVANDGIGDIGEIIRSNNVGYAVDNFGEHELSNAAGAIKALLADPDKTRRCVALANRVFSLENGIDSYHRLYDAVANT